jgi:hypothetical protein
LRPFNDGCSLNDENTLILSFIPNKPNPDKICSRSQPTPSSVMDKKEEERQHLSQELHDEFGQSLTAIKVMAVTAAHEKADTKKITTSMIEICDHLMTVVRSMMKQLHPLILTELGLKATLEDLLHHWEVRHAPTVFTLHYDDAVAVLFFCFIQHPRHMINSFGYVIIFPSRKIS